LCYTQPYIANQVCRLKVQLNESMAEADSLRKQILSMVDRADHAKAVREAEDLRIMIRDMTPREKLAQAEAELFDVSKKLAAAEAEAVNASRKAKELGGQLAESQAELERAAEAAKSHVPRVELLKAQGELRVATEEGEAASASLRVAEGRVAEMTAMIVGLKERCEGLQGMIDTMVSRADLAAARSEAKNAKDELESKARAAHAFEDMCRDLREGMAQVNSQIIYPQILLREFSAS
jgi:chromosome segregation ATPase